jgi:ABC-type transport system substrate-binding protein
MEAHMTRRRSLGWIAAGVALAATAMLVASAAAGTARTSHNLGARSQARPFAEAWAQIPRTTAGRRASSTLVFGEEQDINGFNTSLSCCNQLAGGFLGANEVLRGAFAQNNKGQWVKDIASQATANSKGITYTIKPNASWYWGGKKLPVTWKDFQYTLQQLDSTKNDVASRSGYANLDPALTKHNGLKQVTLFWRTKGCSQDFPCGTYANWKSLFSGLFPSAALQGQDFNKIWFDCICGSDGKPVANGPFYLESYTKGQGTVLKRNPFWWGRNPGGGVKTLVLKIIQDTNTEVQAMRGGEVDAISPTFGLNLLPLKSTPGLVFQQLPGYYLEHVEFNEGKGASNPLLRAPWMREAIALAIDRSSLIRTVYGALAGNTQPLNSLVYYSTQASYKASFEKWNFNQAKSIALLKAHCSGGPNAASQSNNAVWTCSGLPARFRWSWTASNQTRTTSEQIIASELKQVGIDLTAYPRPADVIFGPNGIPGGDFDIAEFAEVTTGDPSDLYELWRCGGASNYQHYCSVKASKMMELGQKVIDPRKAQTYWNQANGFFASNVAAFPLYQRPVPLIYKKGIAGMVNNPGTSGPFWNVEDWRWTS